MSSGHDNVTRSTVLCWSAILARPCSQAIACRKESIVDFDTGDVRWP